MKVLAVDVGDRYLGLAACDGPAAMAQPLFTITRRGGREDFEEVAALARERGAERIVVGVPLMKDGTRTKQAESIAAFAKGLERIAGLPVDLWDERHTSQEATRQLAAVGVSGDERREREHAVAAALLLDSYLATHRAPAPAQSAQSLNGAAALLTEAQREALRQVADAAAALGMPAHLVGGPVRDLLLGRAPAELDCVIEGDALAVAERLAASGTPRRIHEAFGTVTVTLTNSAGALEIDLATARRERYPRPGALPVVEPAALDEDLRRRDFSINAMAARLAPDGLGAIADPFGGAADLAARTIRILHGASFDDDPTRIFRAVQLEVRLGFRMDAETEAQAKDAIARGALATLSGERLGAAVLRVLGEGGATVVERLDDLGVWQAVGWAGGAEPVSWLRAAEASEAMAEVNVVRFRLAALVAGLPPEKRAALGSGWGLERETRAVFEALSQVDEVSVLLTADKRPSEIAARVDRLPPEVVLLAGAMTNETARPTAERYLRVWRHVKPELTGDDLQRLGIERGPRLGEALRALRAAKLDSEVSTRADEEAWVRRLLESDGRNG